MNETAYVLQQRPWGTEDWNQIGEERPAADEPLKQELEEHRDLWGHETECRVIRIKRKALDW